MSTKTCNTTVAGHDYQARIGRDGRVTIVIDRGKETAKGWWREDRIVDIEPPIPQLAVETLEDEFKI